MIIIYANAKTWKNCFRANLKVIISVSMKVNEYNRRAKAEGLLSKQ